MKQTVEIKDKVFLTFPEASQLLGLVRTSFVTWQALSVIPLGCFTTEVRH